MPDSIKVVNIVGGLAADTDVLMPDEMQNRIQSHWRKIHATLGTEFNFDFWLNYQPCRSTYMACRVVLAAKLQAVEELMITAIQHTYYLHALNPSDIELLIRLCQELSESDATIDVDQFSKYLSSESIEQELQSQIALARKLGHQDFPSLV